MPERDESESLEDDQGRIFSPHQLAPLTPELARELGKRSLVNAILLTVVGTLLILVGIFTPRAHVTYRRRDPLLIIAAGGVILLGAAARYAGVIPWGRKSRRDLLKQRTCPVCLHKLEPPGSVLQETVTCQCGAVWGRRFM